MAIHSTNPMNHSGEPTVQSDHQKLVADPQSALVELFSEHRDRLERMVAFRLDARIRGRIDSADVLQEAYLQVSRRMDEYLANPVVSFYVWLRQQTHQVLIDLQRRHFRDRRNPQREVQFQRSNQSDATSYSIASLLVDSAKSPSQVVAHQEEINQVKLAIDSMSEIDREVLALRHFEQLSNQQTAEILGLSETATSNRYVRAATRLGEIVNQLSRSTEAPTSQTQDEKSSHPQPDSILIENRLTRGINPLSEQNDPMMGEDR